MALGGQGDADFPDFPLFPLEPRIAPDVNITGGDGQPLPGFINATAHTSNLAIYYEPSTLPAPFPLVIVSALVSFVLACLGWKTALKSISQARVRAQAVPSGTTIEEVPLQPAVASDGLIHHDDEYMDDDFEGVRSHREPRWARGADGMGFGGTAGTAEADISESGLAPPPPWQSTAAQDLQGGGRDSKTRTRDARVDQAMEDSTIEGLARDDLPPIMRPPVPTARALDDPSDPLYISRRARITVYVAAGFTLLRALVAFGAEMAVAATQGTHAAPSSLFLLLLSIQMFVSNRVLPLAVVLALVLCSALVATAFLMSIWDWSGSRYGELSFEGGRCPVYASDCTSQVYQWTSLGCGATLAFQPIPGHSSYNNPNWGQPFYPPYGTQGNINSGIGVLYIVEAVVGGGGTFWVVPTVLATLWEASKIVRGLYSWSELLHPVPDRFILPYAAPPPVVGPGARRRCPRLGWAPVVGMITFFGLLGSFVAVILSIAGHTAAETTVHHASFIDSFGPAVDTNVTLNSQGFVNATFYGGNATSWSDCFSVPTPVNANGFFAQWLAHNEHVAFRLISLV